MGDDLSGGGHDGEGTWLDVYMGRLIRQGSWPRQDGSIDFWFN